MYRPLLSLIAAAACFAQSPADLFNRPPKGVEEALRPRIEEFYHAHVAARYQDAGKLVAPDSRAFFEASNKPKYVGFHVGKIEYSEDFTKAKATVVVEQFFAVEGDASGKPQKIPIPSRWKLVNGQWYWYVDRVQP
jgi:hypothetical protein